MLKTAKRIFSVLLVTVLIFGATPLAGFVGLELPEFDLFSFKAKAEDIPISGTCGENLIWTFDESTGTLTISGTGEMYEWDNSDTPWQPFCNSIKTVIVEDGVIAIGSCAFEDCTSITKVILANSITRIGWESFRSCQSLSDITISNQLESISTHAFFGCTSLKNINLPNSIETIRYGAFMECTSLKTISIGNSISSIEDAVFSECFSLENIEIGTNSPSYSSENGVLFNKNKSVLIHYPAGNKSSCYKIPDSVTKINELTFLGCIYLENIEVGANNPSYASEDGVLFNKDKTVLIQYPVGSKRTSYTIPNNVTNISIGAFYSCSELKNIIVPNSVEFIGASAFMSTGYYNDESNWENDVLYIGKHLIHTKETIGGEYNIEEGTKTIVGNAFYGCTNISSITLPDSIKNIGMLAFYRCSSISNITIPFGVRSIEDATFMYCTSLKYIVIPSSVTSIELQAFFRCDALTDVYFYGTEEEWNAITIGEGNESLINATIHFVEAPEHSHSYSSSVTKEASCTETGIITYTCNCGDSYTEDIAVTAHTDGEWETVIEATCTAQGKKVKKCTACGTVTANEIIPVITHSDNNSDGFCDSCDRITDENLINGIYIAISPVEKHTIKYMESATLTVTTANLPEGYTVKWVAEGKGVTIKAYGNNCKVTSTSTGSVIIKAYVVDTKGRVVIDENGKPICDSEYFHSDANFWLKIIYFFKMLFKFY